MLGEIDSIERVVGWPKSKLGLLVFQLTAAASPCFNVELGRPEVFRVVGEVAVVVLREVLFAKGIT